MKGEQGRKRGGRAFRDHDWIGHAVGGSVGRAIREPLSANGRLEEECPVGETAEGRSGDDFPSLTG